MKASRGFTLIEVLIALVIVALVSVAFSTMMTSMSLENRAVSDVVERADLERQMGALLADDTLCGCNLQGAPAMTTDAQSPTGAAGTMIVPLPKITTSCTSPPNVFAEPGRKLSALSASFQVAKVAVRDLQPTGRRGPTGANIEYAGAFYVEFDPKASPSRQLRPIKASKIFATDPSGARLASCSSASNFYVSPFVTNAPGVANYQPAVANCPPGYIVRSGGWKTDGKSPTCPSAGDPRPPQILENHPVTTKGGTQAWMVVASCVTLQAIAVCQQGR